MYEYKSPYTVILGNAVVILEYSEPVILLRFDCM